jgi:isoleucyl-tRNA synthetase
MDWERDYYTFSDTNIEYIWRFLEVVHDRGWIVRGHRSTEWWPRCGTSLSQPELSQAGVFQDREYPALTVRLPLLEHPGEALLITMAGSVHGVVVQTPVGEAGRFEPEYGWLAAMSIADARQPIVDDLRSAVCRPRLARSCTPIRTAGA